MLQHVSLVIFQTGLLTALVWDPGLFFHLCDSDGSTCSVSYTHLTLPTSGRV